MKRLLGTLFAALLFVSQALAQTPPVPLGQSGGVGSGGGGGGSGTVSNVSTSGGILSVANPTTTPAISPAGTSGGIPCFNSATTWTSSAALPALALLVGGGAGACPSSTTTGANVLTALGVNVGSAGAFVVNGGALGTPSSGVGTNLTGIPYTALPALSANQLLGALTATTPSGLTVPACAGPSSAWGWTNGVGVVCNAITGSPLTGTSGGVVYFVTGGAAASSPLLTQFQLLSGGGANAPPVGIGSLGSTTQVLHGNASGLPTFGPVNLATDVTGALPTNINTQAGTTYHVLPSDAGKVVPFTSATAVAVALDAPTGSFAAGFCWAPQVNGAGAVTITPASSSILGANPPLATNAAQVLTTGQGEWLCSNGANWQIVNGGLASGGGGTPGGSSGQIQYNNSGSFGGFTLGGDCTFSVPNITCAALNGKAVTLSGPVTTTGPTATTTLAFGATGNTYTFPNSSDTVATLAATQTLTNTLVNGDFAMPQYITGASMWYANPYVNIIATSSVGVANSYYCAPTWITRTVTIKALGVRIATLSAGNTNSALQGAIYSDLITTGNVHRPGTFIDYAGSGVVGFATGSAAAASATMANTTDVLTGPGLYWECVQRFDTTVQYGALTGAFTSGSLVGAAIGSAALGAIVESLGPLNGVSTTGTTYGSAGWVNFTSSTTWVESVSTNFGPVMAIQVN